VSTLYCFVRDTGFMRGELSIASARFHRRGYQKGCQIRRGSNPRDIPVVSREDGGSAGCGPFLGRCPRGAASPRSRRRSPRSSKGRLCNAAIRTLPRAGGKAETRGGGRYATPAVSEG
jgi:hypothetical protein